MNAVRAFSAALALLAVVDLSGCLATRVATPPSIPETPLPPATAVPPVVPDAVPRVEPRSRYGNPPFYEVFGKRYYVLSSSTAYVERGVASWYGPGFHQERTSTGETYDMYGMTAAHKTLPLPAYVRVTNLQNGRSVVVRVNDRGPFVGNRLIDLSYSAASRLGMLRNGTAMVEVRAIEPSSGAGAASAATASTTTASITPPSAGAAPGDPPNAATPPSTATAPVGPPTAATPLTDTPRAPLFVQAGAFADPRNAERLVAKLRGGGYGNIFVRDDIMAGRKMYRVRIGPVPDVPEFDRIVAALERAGVHDAHLALD
ncbi:MAG: septal ring lytic transglycosylase RlpA family protein [Pseudomonadota bacterium]|nr:septal ring lytic transglycosylase RlpA family protein [Pseudomonadota bacterium]